MTGAGSEGMATIGFPTRAPIELEDRPREQQWLVDALWGAPGGRHRRRRTQVRQVLPGARPRRRRLRRRPVPAPLRSRPARTGPDVRRRGRRPHRAQAPAGHRPRRRRPLRDPRHRRHRRPGAAPRPSATTGSRLQQTVERIAPRLLVLDPLVRLHGVDENAVADVAPILGFLRDIQRRFETAVLLVHHARKSGATRPGQALRGSSELHAWGDSNLYLRRRDRQTLMTVEHRAARGLDDIEIELKEDGDAEEPSFRLRQPPPTGGAPQPETPERRILKALDSATTPLSQRQIRERAATRNKTVAAILQRLVRAGRLRHDADGRYCLLESQSEKAAPAANGRDPGAERFPVPPAHT